MNVNLCAMAVKLNWRHNWPYFKEAETFCACFRKYDEWWEKNVEKELVNKGNKEDKVSSKQIMAFVGSFTCRLDANLLRMRVSTLIRFDPIDFWHWSFFLVVNATETNL